MQKWGWEQGQCAEKGRGKRGRQTDRHQEQIEQYPLEVVSIFAGFSCPGFTEVGERERSLYHGTSSMEGSYEGRDTEWLFPWHNLKIAHFWLQVQKNTLSGEMLLSHISLDINFLTDLTL